MDNKKMISITIFNIISLFIILLFIISLISVLFYKNKANDSLYELINPFSPYFICDHYLSDELFDTFYWNNNFDKKLIKGNNLLKNKNYNKIKDYDIIFCQFTLFKYFVNDVLPKINKKIILFTSMAHLTKSGNGNSRDKITDDLLKNDKILLWVSTNPIYENHPKYMAFPYGFNPLSIYQYYYYIKKNKTINKTIEVSNLYSCAHKHLPHNHIRKKYKILGVNSGNRLNYKNYLDIISKSKFLISTAGDRDDCFRHYEAIGLETVPISNINYEEIFGDSMYTTSENNLVKIATSKKSDIEYKKPNKNIIYFKYWKNKLYERIENLK